MNIFDYYMFYKPYGCVTAQRDEKEKTIMEYLKDLKEKKIQPVGRLDKETEGFLLLTNDGKFNQFLTHPDNHISKTYFFYAMGVFTEEKKKKIEQGICLQKDTIQGKKQILTKPAVVELEESLLLKELKNRIPQEIFQKISKNLPEQPIISGFITITEGKKHQVRRMLKAAGCYVVYLKRTAIGKVKLDENLKRGEYRKLTREEYECLKRER